MFSKQCFSWKFYNLLMVFLSAFADAQLEIILIIRLLLDDDVTEIPMNKPTIERNFDYMILERGTYLL